MIEARLNELGITLPQASAPAAKYANAVIVNGIMYVSGKGPDTSERGKLGSDFTTEQGYDFAGMPDWKCSLLFETCWDHWIG